MLENLNLMNKICLHYKDKKEEDKYLFLEEKLISLTLDFLSVNSPTEHLEYNIESRINEFIQAINLKVLETYNKAFSYSDTELRLFSKGIDLLHSPHVKRVCEKNPEKLQELKILAFNNLSCIHRKNQNYPMAFKAVSYALKMENEQLKTNPNKIETVKNIISTYLNQAVICSELRKHEESVKMISIALSHLEQLEKLLKNQQDAKNYEENYQGYLYLKMVSYFNLAVENEYLCNQSKAIAFYQETVKLASEMNNSEILKKSEVALTKLNKKNQKF